MRLSRLRLCAYTLIAVSLSMVAVAAFWELRASSTETGAPATSIQWAVWLSIVAILLRPFERSPLGFAWLAIATGFVLTDGSRIVGISSPPALGTRPEPPAAITALCMILWLTGVIVLVRRSFPARHRSLWLDSVIALFAGGSVVTGFAMEGVIGDSRASALPVGLIAIELVALGICAMGVAMTGWRLAAGWPVALTALVSFMLAQALYAHRVAEGGYVFPEINDVMTYFSVALCAVAAWRIRAADPATASTPVGLRLVAMPLLFAVLALGVLVIGSFQPIHPVGAILAAAGLGAALVRAAITFQEIGSINAELAAARGQSEHAERRLAHIATHDELTGLANRRRLNLALDSPAHRVAAVIYVDLDRFKEVNDELGHAAGDQVLREVSMRLQAVTRPDDLVARIGGDEFVILCADVVTHDAAQKIGARIVTILSASIDVDGTPVQIGASVGIAIEGDVAVAAEALLREADRALYIAKESGRGRAVVA